MKLPVCSIQHQLLTGTRPSELSANRATIAGDYGLGHFENGKKIGEVCRELADL